MDVPVPEPPSGFWAWLLTAIATGVSVVFAAMSKALSIMYHNEKQSNKESITKLEAKLEAAIASERKCQEQHEALAVVVAKLETRLEHLEKRN